MDRRLTTILSARIGVASPDCVVSTSTDAVRESIGIGCSMISELGGRIIRTTSSGLTAEFSSVVSAVQIAVDMRLRIEERNKALLLSKHICVAIGIDLWDMIVESDGTFRGGELVAMRLEEAAEPGEILISETVHQHVHRHLPLTFEDAGKRLLKDDFTLIPTFRVLRYVPSVSQSHGINAFQASLAVLPFSNAGGDPEKDYLCDGLTEELISYLSKNVAMYVVPPDRVFGYRGSSQSLSQLAVELGVQYILRGSVRVVGEVVTLYVQLHDGHIGGRKLSEGYRRSLDQIVDLKDTVSQDVVHALRLKLRQDVSGGQPYRGVSGGEAYRFYLMGRSYFRGGHTRRFLRLAKQMFQRALDGHPGFAAAHAGLADCNAFLLEAGELTIPVDQILYHSTKALEFDDTLAEAHASMGLAMYAICNYGDAETCFKRAIELQPDLFEAYYFFGRNCLNQAQFFRAAELFGQAAQLRRDDFRSLGLQSMCYSSMSQLAEARSSATAALARAERAVGERPDDADALSFGAGLLAFLGEYSRTKAWAERADFIAPDDYYAQYNIACAYAVIGERESAISKLKSIMDINTPHSRIEYMLQDSDLDTLRSHELYKEWIVNLLG